jgi:UDP-glucose 4-epimerase
VRVLVTGGSGFVGRALVSRLAARGDEVRVVDLRPFPDPRVDALVGDLRDPATVEAALAAGVDAVVHLAAVTSVLRSKEAPHEVFTTNVVATELLLERCRTLGVGRFVLASSNAVVGDVGRRTIDETLPLAPLTPYGATKAAGEMLCSAYAASFGLVAVALRFTNLYGPGMQDKDSVVARLMRAAITGSGIEVYGDGEQLRDYLYIDDACRALELALALPGPATLCVGAGRSVSMNELHRLACEATGRAIGKVHVPPKAGEMPAVIVDTSRLASLGLRPTVDLAEGLEATWRDFVARS